MACLVAPECRGRQFLPIDQVCPGEGLPSIAHEAWRLHLFAPHLHPIADHLGLGREEEILLFCHFEGAQGFTIRTVEAFGIVERYVGRPVTNFHRLEKWPGRHTGMSIGAIQRPSGQSLSHLLLVPRMHVERVSPIRADRHTAVCHLTHQAPLAVSEPGPAGTVQAGELHIVEGKLLLPLRAPTFGQQFEQLFVCLDVVGVRFALIPEEACDREALQRSDARFEEVAGLVGVALLLVFGAGDILGAPFACPVHHEVILFPVVKDVGKLKLQCLAVDPCFRG